jgi:hypothetical protein
MYGLLQISERLFSLSSLISLCLWDDLWRFTENLYTFLISRSSTALCWTLADFSVSWSTQSVGLLGREISRSQGLYLHTEQHKHRINAHTYLLEVGLEPMIPAFERAKRVHALDRAVTVIGMHAILSTPLFTSMLGYGVRNISSGEIACLEFSQRCSNSVLLD